MEIRNFDGSFEISDTKIADQSIAGQNKLMTKKGTIDSDVLNHLTARAMLDPKFIEHAIALISELELPTCKYQIIAHIGSVSSDPEMIALYNTLNDYIQYHDQSQIRAAF